MLERSTRKEPDFLGNVFKSDQRGSVDKHVWLHERSTLGFGLRSVSGESGAEGGEERLANRSRSATPAAEPQTKARRSCGTLRMLARDERAVCGVERAAVERDTGRRAARGAQQIARWSRQPKFKTFVSTTETNSQPTRQLQAAGVLHVESRSRSGQGRTRGRGDCVACAA